MNVEIRRAVQSDFQGISDLAMSAFGIAEGPEIVQLIGDLSADVTAQPVLSLVAVINESVVGHVLFSAVRLEPPGQNISATILAPLAVRPDFQSQGIGGQLISEGLRQLSGSGVDLVFVLGHPGYYPRFGFSAAGIKGFQAPYPIPPKNAEAWMVLELRPGIIGITSGQVICADALADPRYWRE
jgi:predicted N-acetyltransferase YhbS